MSNVIGNASDFYRLRVIRLDEGDVPEMEWRDDVLYRRSDAASPDEYDVWRVEAVDVEDDENVTLIGTFDTVEDAERWVDTAGDDLSTMTKSEFERTYFPSETDE